MTAAVLLCDFCGTDCTVDAHFPHALDCGEDGCSCSTVACPDCCPRCWLTLSGGGSGPHLASLTTGDLSGTAPAQVPAVGPFGSES